MDLAIIVIGGILLVIIGIVLSVDREKRRARRREYRAARTYKVPKSYQGGNNYQKGNANRGGNAYRGGGSYSGGGSYQRADYVDPEEFVKRKNQVSNACNEESVKQFFEFLKNYKGSYVRRDHGKIVHQEYTGQEKGALKGLFFHVIVPSQNLSVETKENARIFIQSAGVNGLEQRPNYEMDDSALINMEKGDDYHKKSVGNKGELKVRNVLAELDSERYKVINGISLKKGNEKHEFDHIVVKGKKVYLIETKAFGSSEFTKTGDERAVIHVTAGDEWQLEKNGSTKSIKAPSRQIQNQKRFMEYVLRNTGAEVINVMVLANSKLKITGWKSVSYPIVKLQNLLQFFSNEEESTKLTLAGAEKDDRDRIVEKMIGYRE